MPYADSIDVEAASVADQRDRTRAMEARLLMLAAGGLKGGAFIHILLGIFTVIALYGGTDHGRLHGWLAALTLAALARSGLSWLWLNRYAARPRLGGRILVFSGLLVGLAWGALPLLFFADAGMQQRIVIVFVMGGMSLGAMAVSGYYPPAFYALFLAAFPPLLPWYFLPGTGLSISMGAMLIAFFATLIYMARRFGRTVRDIVSLEFVRDWLLRSLSDAGETLEAAMMSRSDSVAIFDADDRLLIWNETFARRYQTDKLSLNLKAGVSFETLLRDGLKAQGRTGPGAEAWLSKRLLLHQNPGPPFEERMDDRWYLVREFRTEKGHRVVVHTDITSLKEREAALSEQEAAKAAIISGALDAVLSFDDGGTVLAFNDAAERVFGSRAGAIIGASVVDRLIPRSARADLVADLDRYRRSGESRLVGRRSELTLLRADAKPFPAEISLIHSMVGGRGVFTAFIRDIGERLAQEERLRQALDQAERASRAKSEFLATVSHELRTPMNGILGAVDLLLDGALESDQQRLAKTARQAGEALQARLDDIIDYADIEARRIDLEPAPFHPAALIENCAAAFRDHAEARGLPISVSIAADVPRQVSGDAGRLRQILFNLVSNAVKFTSKGEIALRVERRAGDDGFVVLRFLVKDSGIGIPDGLRERIFSPFSQADPGATRRHGGAGVGLSIARGLVELMNGRIDFASSPDRGSSFWCDLPFLIIKEQSAERRDADGESRPRLAGTHCLIVDDSEANRLIVSETLRRAGARVTEAASGLTALEALTLNAFDAILMDISMPEMDGIETLRRVRSAGHDRVPVIAMTANSGAGNAADRLGGGFAAWLSKPVRRESLIATVASATGEETPFVAMPQPRSDSTTLLDERLFRLVESDVGPEMFERLLDSFIGEARERAADISKCHADGDMAAVRLNAHALKSAAATFGAMRLAAESELVEHLANGEALAALGKALPSFLGALEESLDRIGKLREARQAE